MEKVNINQKNVYNNSSKKLQKVLEVLKMENNQKINCTVQSCKYNNVKQQICELNSIMVTPKQNVNTGKPDESECSSYECE